MSDILASAVAEGKCAGQCRHDLAGRGVTNADVARNQSTYVTQTEPIK